MKSIPVHLLDEEDIFHEGQIKRATSLKSRSYQTQLGQRHFSEGVCVCVHTKPV